MTEAKLLSSLDKINDTCPSCKNWLSFTMHSLVWNHKTRSKTWQFVCVCVCVYNQTPVCLPCFSHFFIHSHMSLLHMQVLRSAQSFIHEKNSQRWKKQKEGCCTSADQRMAVLCRHTTLHPPRISHTFHFLKWARGPTWQCWETMAGFISTENTTRFWPRFRRCSWKHVAQGRVCFHSHSQPCHCVVYSCECWPLGNSELEKQELSFLTTTVER